MTSTEEEVDGRPVDEIAKIAGPVGGLWVAWNDHGISGASFANTTTFARFREEHHDRTGRGAARADAMPDDVLNTSLSAATPQQLEAAQSVMRQSAQACRGQTQP